MSEKEWYIEIYENNEYLHHKVLKKVQFGLPYSHSDHEHCAHCWAKISNFEGDYHYGYFEPISKDWICEGCFREYKDLYGWSEE